MAITQAVCSTFKQQLLEAIHDFRQAGGDTFKLALYTSSATLDASTTVYSATNEVGNSGTYSAGGGALVANSANLSGTTAYTDFADISFTSATITARGALIYNSTPTHTYTNPACFVLDFGSDKTSTNGTFTITFPLADATNAIYRLP